VIADSFVDAEGAIADWINRQTDDLVGVGHPLTKGAMLIRQRGAASVCYALITIVGGGTTGGAENPDQVARISAQIFGPSKEDAAAAAVAYANTVIARLNGSPYVLPTAVILGADPDSLSGPLWAPDFDEPRYLVDIDFVVRPA
jgi:hypothetical protein